MTQDQNFETSRTMGMNRGFLGRAIALGLFVSVGTFAVTHSLTKPKSLAQSDVTDEKAAEVETPSDSRETPGDSPKVVDNIPAIVAANTAAIEKTAGEGLPNVMTVSNRAAANDGPSGFSLNPGASPSPTRDARNLGESAEKEKNPGVTKLRDRTESDFGSKPQDKPTASAPDSGDASNAQSVNGLQNNLTSSPTNNGTGGRFEPPPSKTFEPSSSQGPADDKNHTDQAKLPSLRITNPADLGVSNPTTARPNPSTQSATVADSGFTSPPVRSMGNLSGTSPKLEETNPNLIRPLVTQSGGETTRPEPLGGQGTPTTPPAQPRPNRSLAESGTASGTPASSGMPEVRGAITPPGGQVTPELQNQPQIQYPIQVSSANQSSDSAGRDPPARLNSPSVKPPPATTQVENQPFVTQPTAQPVTPAIAGQTGFPPAATPPTNPLPSRSEASSTLPMIPADSRLEARPLATSGIAGTSGTPGEAALEGLQRPSLAIEKIAPSEIQVNQIAKFKIVVRNVGQVTATEVIVSDQIPAGAELIGANPPAENRTSDGRVQWNLGKVAAGDEKSIELEIRPTRPGEIGSVAQVTFATQASARTRVTRPELSVEHSGPAKVLIGNQVPLRFVVHNRGDGPATDVLLLERVPNQLKFNDDFRDLEYPVGTILPGQSKEISLSLTAIEAGRFNNVVMVTGKGGLESRHQIEIEVIAPQLEGEISGPTRRFLKREAAHTFTTANSGTAPATNVDIVARLPRGVQFVSANNRGQYDPGSHSVYWSLAELSPSQSASVELSTLPIETGNHEIEFRTTADLKQSVTRRQALTIEHLVDVFFDIRDTTDPIEVGGRTSYRIRIINQGTKPASEVRLELNMAEGVRATRVDSTTAHEIRGQTVSFAPIANINPGEEVIVEVEAVGTTPGEHRVSANLRTAEREINLTKEESTRVYADR